MGLKATILAVIPARAGSKGVKNKNIRELGDKPLIEYTINAAVESAVFADIWVTTDSPAIQSYAQSRNVFCPQLREESLSGDQALAVDTVVDALVRAEKYLSKTFDFVCMLQPTSPLRTFRDCQDAVKLLTSGDGYDSLVSGVAVSEHPHKMFRISEGRLFQKFLDWPVENPPRQTLPEVYVYNGAFYIVDAKILKEKKTFLGKSTIVYTMPRERSVNIDSEIDFRLAEILLQEER